MMAAKAYPCGATCETPGAKTHGVMPFPGSKRGRQYEGSAEDMRKDAREAKRRGMTPAEFEGSPADERMDAAGQRKLDRKRMGRG